MYFASRQQAGRMLANQLVEKYRYENCAIIALTDGAAVIGIEIASRLHCTLTLLTNAEIKLPREPVALAGITASGAVAYNRAYSPSEIDEMTSEYYGLIEQEKLSRMYEMSALMGSKGSADTRLLEGHNVIVVSDGLSTGFPIDLAAEFLKPIAIKKLIVATPFASVPAVDRMHVVADELYCLSVIEDYIDTNHYYNKQDVPDHETVLKMIENIVLKWK
jgi:predicted phosphoribosyltransferase